MDTMTLSFLVIGGLGVLILLLGVVVGEFGGADADGPLALRAIPAFFGGGGFGGAATACVVNRADSYVLRLLAAIGVGLVVAIPLAWCPLKLTARLMKMRTDKTFEGSDVVGALGTVVTGIGQSGYGESGYGEVRVAVGGHMRKFDVRSQKPLPVGTPIYVVDIPIVQKLHVIDLSSGESRSASGVLSRSKASSATSTASRS